MPDINALPVLVALNPAELAAIDVEGLAVIDARGRLFERNPDLHRRLRWWVTGSVDTRAPQHFPVHVVRHPAALEQSIVITVGELLAAASTTAADIVVASAVPRHRTPVTAAYYTATDRKHFSDRTQPGSKFTDPALNTLEDVVRLAITQRGSLDGDDRVRFCGKGSDPEAFIDGHRYLAVNTPGTVGVIRSTELADDDLIDIVRTKPGVPVSFVATVDEQSTTDTAVVILIDDASTGVAQVITAFPGPVTKPVENSVIELMEGRTVTVDLARKILGEEFWANTRLPRM